MYRIVRFWDYLLNEDAAVAANNTSSATAGQQASSILVSYYGAQPYGNISTVQQQSTCLYDRAYTRSGRENIRFAVWVSRTGGCRCLFYLKKSVAKQRIGPPKLLQTGAKDQASNATTVLVLASSISTDKAEFFA